MNIGSSNFGSCQFYQKILVLIAYCLFFLILFVPTTYQSVKAIFLAIIVGALIVKAILQGKMYLHESVLLWTLFLVAIGIGFVMLGMLNNAPGALRVSTVFVVWPLVYTLLLSGVSSRWIIDGLFKVMVFSLIVISLYTISYLLYAGGLIAPSLYIELNMGQAVGFYEGYVEYRLYNIASLNFLVPMLITMVLVHSKHEHVSISRVWLWLACVLGVLVAILSGRRAVWVVLLIAPFLGIAARMAMSKQFRADSRRQLMLFVVVFMVFVVTILLVGSVWLGLDFLSMLGKLTEGFDFTNGGESESVRSEQFFALIHGWFQNPLFGAGHGASVSGYVRSYETPWAYELSYISLLFHVGLVGVFFYSLGVMWILWMSLKIMRSGHWLGVYLLPVIVAMICFLIANATNPYLEKFDFIWVIFLPVSLINCWLLDQGGIYMRINHEYRRNHSQLEFR